MNRTGDHGTAPEIDVELLVREFLAVEAPGDVPASLAERVALETEAAPLPAAATRGARVARETPRRVAVRVPPLRRSRTLERVAAVLLVGAIGGGVVWSVSLRRANVAQPSGPTATAATPAPSPTPSTASAPAPTATVGPSPEFPAAWLHATVPLPDRASFDVFVGPTAYVGFETSAVAGTPTKVLVSDDGLAWREAAELPAGTTIASIAYGSSQVYVAAGAVGGSPAAFRSRDLRRWEASTAPGTAFSGARTELVQVVAVEGRGFVALERYLNGTDPGRASAALWRSADGSTWTRLDYPRLGQAGSVPYLFSTPGLFRLYAYDYAPTSGWDLLTSWSSADGMQWTPEYLPRAGFGQPFAITNQRRSQVDGSFMQEAYSRARDGLVATVLREGMPYDSSLTRELPSALANATICDIGAHDAAIAYVGGELTVWTGRGATWDPPTSARIDLRSSEIECALGLVRVYDRAGHAVLIRIPDPPAGID